MRQSYAAVAHIEMGLRLRLRFPMKSRSNLDLWEAGGYKKCVMLTTTLLLERFLLAYADALCHNLSSTLSSCIYP